MYVEITYIPEWVTFLFGLEVKDRCKVARKDFDKDEQGRKRVLYLVETKNGKSVTVYENEIKEVES